MNDFHSASLFSPEDIAARDWDAQDIAVALHGDVDKKGVLAPKEGHSESSAPRPPLTANASRRALLLVGCLERLGASGPSITSAPPAR
jgi:hypothetical protein